MEGKKKKVLAGSLVAALGATVGAVLYSKKNKKASVNKKNKKGE